MKTLFALFFLFVISVSAQEDVLMHVDSYIKAKEYNKAKTLLLDNISKNPTAALKERLGDVYSYLREWDEAIPIYKELVEADSKNAQYQFKYGGALGRKAEVSSRFMALTLIGRIKSSFLKAAELDPKYIEARWGLVDYYTSVPSLLGGSVSKAINYANQLKAISPIEGYFALAYIYEQDDETFKVDENFKKTVQYFDQLDYVERNQLNYLIGKVCANYNLKLDKGIYHLKEFIKRHTVKDGSPLYLAYYSLAKIYRLKNDKQNADYWISKVLKDKPDFEMGIEERKIIDQL